MTKLEKLALFLRFWFSPWGAAKGVIWEEFSNDLGFTDVNAETICRHIMEGDEEAALGLHWEVLEKFDAA